MGFNAIVNFDSGQVTQAPSQTKAKARLRVPQENLEKRIAELEHRLAVLESAIAVAPGGTVTLRGQTIYLEATSFIYLGSKTKVMAENLKVKTLEYTKADKLKFFG